MHSDQDVSEGFGFSKTKLSADVQGTKSGLQKSFARSAHRYPEPFKTKAKIVAIFQVCENQIIVFLSPPLKTQHTHIKRTSLC